MEKERLMTIRLAGNYKRNTGMIPTTRQPHPVPTRSFLSIHPLQILYAQSRELVFRMVTVTCQTIQKSPDKIYVKNTWNNLNKLKGK